MSETNETNSILPLLEEATQASPNSIDLTESLPDLEGWDSMGMVMFIGLVKLKHSVQLTVHDLRECRRVEDIQKLVEES